MAKIYWVPMAALAFAASQPQGEGKQDEQQDAKTTATAVAGAAPSGTAAANALPSAKAGACMMQDDKVLDVRPLRALGTEPFWGANVEGRCVTYTTPEDQKGTRIWTRYTATADGGRWSGSLGGRKFELVTRKQADCSDGMSDNKFPMAAELMVNGEQRKGCARP